MNAETKEAFVFMGVPQNGTKQDIHNSYLRLSKKYHPDMNGGSTQLFQMLRDSYNTANAYFDIEEKGAIKDGADQNTTLWIASAIEILNRIQNLNDIPGLTYGQRKIIREAKQLADLLKP